MRAIVCPALGDESVLRLTEVPAPACGPDEVRIRVRAAAVNFPDCLIIRGQYQFRAEPPFIPGHECAGEVLETGADVRGFAPGDRVLALTGTGAFADEAVTKAGGSRVYRIPDLMPWEHAAGFLLTYGTAMHALHRRAALLPGESVLVLGAAGGCGSAAVQVAKAMGATVLAAAGGPGKCALAAAMGADYVIDYLDESVGTAVRDRTGRGVDVVFDPVGGSDIREPLRAMARNGRYAVVGFAAGAIPTVSLNQTILRSVSLVGVAYGASIVAEPDTAAADMSTLLAWYGKGLIEPHVGDRCPLHAAGDALRIVYERRARGKVVLDVP